jgi:hypothetical protein
VIGVFIGRALSFLFGVAAAIVIGIALHGCAQARNNSPADLMSSLPSKGQGFLQQEDDVPPRQVDYELR